MRKNKRNSSQLVSQQGEHVLARPLKAGPCSRPIGKGIFPLHHSVPQPLTFACERVLEEHFFVIPV